jgi:hypothetical protein
MSTYGVRRRFVDVLVRGSGLVSEADFTELVAYARERGITAGEAKALLQPANYLRTSRVLRTRGIRLEDVRLDAGAWTAAEALGRELGVAAPFADLPNARPTAPTPTPTPTPAPAEIPAGGQRLGEPATWRLETSGAVLTFATRVGDRTYPAVVLANPAWKDPGPARDLVAEHRTGLDAVTSLAGLVAFVRDVATKERAYLEAEGVATRFANERYAIQDARRHGFFEALAGAASGLRLPADERGRIRGVLIAEKERLLCDRDYVMETGSHENYWPYWNNFSGAIARILKQTAPGTDAYLAIKNRLEDIHDRKTVFGFRRQIDEQDLETSLGGALVHRLQFSDGSGHRVSLARDSYPTAPVYEVLEVASTELPAGHEARARAAVYRDTDLAGTLRFDPGKEAVPEALARHVHARRVPPAELGLRPFAPGEAPRRGIPGDWNRDRGISVTPIEIDWWGHCHNEAPLNAMGVDPKRAVTLYRAGRGIPAADALQTFSADEVWDLFGALTADHEGGYATFGSFGMRQAQIEVTKFVGSRNDGGHWFMLEIDRPGARRIRVHAEVTELWHRSDPTQKYDRPEERFRRDLPNPDGTFDPNPDWIEAEVTDEDEITIDSMGRRLTFTATYVTFDARGERRQKKESVELDPTKDAWVKIGDEIISATEPRGGKLAEHWYNPRQARYYRTVVDVGPDGRRGAPEQDPPVRVARALSRQETVYDSVTDIHDFVTKNMGLPFTFDTSAGLAVWNYPVQTIRIDRTYEVQRIENGRTYDFTTYRLRYTTMGGPAGDARYIIKRDAGGNAVRALALDPMPDFAYRNEYWVCAPVVADGRGNAAYNVHALEAGFLTDRQRERLVTDLWRRQAAICYASLAAPGGGDTVYLFEGSDGELIVYPDAASFQAAVDAARRAQPG